MANITRIDPFDDLFLPMALDGVFQRLDGRRILATSCTALRQHQGQLGTNLLAQGTTGELSEFF